MAITQNHVINIQPGVSAPLVIHCSQGDTGTQINLTVVNGDEEFDCSSYACSVHGVRSDGGNWGPIACTVSGSTVCFSLTSAMTAVAGACLAEISVGTVGTANFAILVENATFSLGVTYTEDTSVYQSILSYNMGAVQNIKAEATAGLNKAIDQMNANTNAVNAKYDAAIDQMNAKANDLQNQYDVTNAKLDTAISAVTQDSEVQDIRVKADGTSATTAGNAVREQITELKNDLNDVINGTNRSFNVTAGKINSFKYVFLKGIQYTVTNNTGSAINFKLVQKDGTEKIISGNFSSGNSINFVPDRNDFVMFTSWVPSGATGTIDLLCDYSILAISKETLENLNNLNNYADSNDDFILNSYYGTNKSLAVVASKQNEFNLRLLQGVKYTFQNNTGVNINLRAIRQDGTEDVIITNLSNNNITVFIPERNDYTKIKSYVSAGASGVIIVSTDFSIVNQLLDINDWRTNIIDLTPTLTEGEFEFLAHEYQISSTKNNDGTATYIWKKILECEINPGESIYIRCKNATNTINNPFYLHQYIGTTLARTTSYTLTQVKNGLVIVPDAGVDNVSIRLYASQSGGLVDLYAEFTDIIVSKGIFGHPKINQNLLTDWSAPPAYYFENNYIGTKIESVLQTMENAGGNYDAFIFCTDQHWRLNAQQSPKLIKYLSDRLCIPRLFMGGDYEDGVSFGAYRAYKDLYAGRIYNIIGNHEYMDGQFDEVTGQWTARTNTDATIHACLNGDMYDAVFGDVSRNYYYVDNTVQKMRYIVLSIFTDNSEIDFSVDQQSWLSNTALNLPDGYTAIVFAHHIASVNHETGELEFTSYDQTICDIVDAYNGNGEIACLIGGHTHFDGLGTTPGGIPVFVTTCDKYIPYSGGGEEYLADRTLGTIDEQAFDVFVINKASKTVNAIRIGCPAYNPTGEALQIREATY